MGDEPEQMIFQQVALEREMDDGVDVVVVFYLMIN